MKKYIVLIGCVFGLLLSSCSKKCDDAKAPESPSFFIEIVDETTGENVFENMTYDKNQYVVQYLDDSDVPNTFLDDTNVIHIVPAYDSVNSNTVKVVLNNPDTMDTETIEIQFNIARMEQECYTLHSISNLSTPNHQTTFQDLVYVIKI